MTTRFSLMVFALALLIGMVFVVRAQTTEGITFPVPELGNCASKDACRAYCNEPANMAACIAFATAHGLMNKEEASRAEEFHSVLEKDGGPGGCRTPEACKTFCSNLANIDACIAFAEKHGFKNSEVEQGKKISAYLKSGGTLPGGCTSKETCESYCSDFSNAEACAAFGKKIGVAPGDSTDRMIELMKRGETPGGCRSQGTCETYCRDHAHFDECIAFAQKAGFVKPEQADAIKQHGGKGPGACESREQCETYCNQETHRDECLKFAEENGFVEKGDLETIKGGIVQLRAGLEQVPPEVRECVQAVLGPDVIEGIQAGTQLPSPEIGNRMRSCFEKFGMRGAGMHLEKPEKGMMSSSSGMRGMNEMMPLTNFPPRREAPSSSFATSTSSGPVCADNVTCARVCGDAASQFYGYPDCVGFRENLQHSGVPQELRGELPPSLENLPTDSACPDPVTCAARCTNDASPYYLKDECVEYRLGHPESRSGTSLFFANILSQFKALFK